MRNQQTDWTSDTAPQVADVGGPDERFVLVSCKLHLDDDPVHWPVLHEQNDQIGAIFHRPQVIEIGGIDPRFRRVIAPRMGRNATIIIEPVVIILAPDFPQVVSPPLMDGLSSR